MSPVSRSDGATDLTIGLLLVVGTACWVGLIAGQLGRFQLAPVALAGAAAAVVAVRGLRRHGPEAPADGAARRRALDGPIVFLLAALLYVPGYDAALFGSDASVYFGTGAHLARTGALAVEEPLLRELPPNLMALVFPPMTGGPTGQAPAARSASGLVIEDAGRRVYSTFSQLPSVWMAIGFASGGVTGGRSATPLLAAAGMMAFFLMVRRVGGVAGAVLSVALLALALPQLLFARLTMGECGAQFFLWGAFLAYDRFRETGSRLTAVAAGLGLGLAGLARPEYIAFLPLAAILLRVLPGERARVPAHVGIIAGLLFVHAAVLILFVVPSHYRGALGDLLQTSGLLPALAMSIGHVCVAAALAVAGAVGMALAEGMMRGGSVAALALVAVWAVVYGSTSPSASVGQVVAWLPQYTGWPVLSLAAVGLPLLVVRWWRSPAARLACLSGLVAAAHIFYDVHTAPFPAWAARRLLPVVLPLMCVSAASAIAALARGRALATGFALLVLASNLWNSRPVFGMPYFVGASDAVARVAELVPADAVVLLDPALSPTLLDVPLLLVHGRDAIQGRGPSDWIDAYGPLFALQLPRRPVYVIRPGTFVSPRSTLVRFDPQGEVRAPVLSLADDPARPGPLFLRVYRVVVEPR